MTDQNHSLDQLQIIGQLAGEYEQKYRELEALISEIPPEKSFSQLKALAERTTDRFRSAQVALFFDTTAVRWGGKRNCDDGRNCPLPRL